MPSFRDLLCSLTVRLNHEEDFAFTKVKEDLALTVRANHLPKIREVWGSKDATLSFDDEGDISIQGRKGNLLMTRDAVVLTAWFVPVGWVSEGRNFSEIATLLDEAFGTRKLVQTSGYEVRMYLSLRFKEDLPDDKLVLDHFQQVTSQLTAGESPAKVNTLRWALEYSRADIRHRWELRSERQEFQVRYWASHAAGQFKSVGDFLTAVQPSVADSISKMEPLIAPFIQDPEKLRGLVFATTD